MSYLGGFMSTGSTSASSSTLTSSSGAGGLRNGHYILPETFVDENGFQRPLNEIQTRRAGNTVSKTLIRWGNMSVFLCSIKFHAIVILTNIVYMYINSWKSKKQSNCIHCFD